MHYMYMHKHYGVSIIHFRFFCMIDLHALPFNHEGLVLVGSLENMLVQLNFMTQIY